MRNIISTFLIICTFITNNGSDKYYVTFVKGKVILAKTKVQIKTGDVLAPDDRVVFADAQGKISCINPVKGRFDISPKAKTANGNQLFAIIKSSLVPATTNHSLSTRSVFFEGNDPMVYFSAPETQNRILLIEKEPLLIKSTYKMDKTNFFFVQYVDNGKMVIQKIPHQNQALLFSKSILASTHGAGLETVSLCYQSDASGKATSVIIKEFHPILVERNEIIKEVRLIITNYAEKNNLKKLKSEIVNHLYDNYGKIGAEEFEQLHVLE